MRAILLAAGRGSRMGNHTNDRPKCLVELAGHPLLAYQVSALQAAGVTDIAAVGGWMRHRLEGRGLTLVDNPDWATSNMVASLACMADWLRAGPCLVSYTDIFYTPEAPRVLLAGPEAPLSITYDPAWATLWERRFADPLADAETFRLTADGTLLEIGNRPASMAEVQGQYMGLLRFTPQAWAAVEALRATLTAAEAARQDMTSLLRALLGTGMRIQARPISTPWGEVDSAEDLALYQGWMGTTPRSLPFTGY